MELKAYTWNRDGLQVHTLVLPTGTFGVTIADQIEGHDIEVTYDDDMPTVELTLDGAIVRDFDNLRPEPSGVIRR